tara:strand:- start:63 stop:425 length:363 start_codon:yes stop_codon:yes gene_type:complete
MSEYVIKIGTVKGRHEMPVDYYVFEEIDPNDVFNFPVIQGLAVAEVMKIFDKGIDRLDETFGKNVTIRIELYVTGLTSATICVLNAIKAITQNNFQKEVRVYAMHYDRETGEYCSQVVIL